MKLKLLASLRARRPLIILDLTVAEIYNAGVRFVTCVP